MHVCDAYYAFQHWQGKLMVVRCPKANDAPNQWARNASTNRPACPYTGLQPKRVQKNIDRRTSPWIITITHGNTSNNNKNNKKTILKVVPWLNPQCSCVACQLYDEDRDSARLLSRVNQWSSESYSSPPVLRVAMLPSHQQQIEVNQHRRFGYKVSRSMPPKSLDAGTSVK